MERENEPDNLDINDYHRLRYLGDNVNEILQSVLENIRAGIGLFEVGESIRALYLNDAYFQCIGYSKEDYDKEIQDVLSTLLPEDAAGFLACISENAPKGRPIYYIIREAIARMERSAGLRSRESLLKTTLGRIPFI